MSGPRVGTPLGFGGVFGRLLLGILHNITILMCITQDLLMN